MSEYKLVKEGNRSVVRVDISPYDIIHDLLSTEERQELIESLSCHDEIIEAVMQQVLDGYTENGFCGWTSPSLNSPVQKARLRIANESDYAVRCTIEQLENRIKSLEKDVEYWRSAYDKSVYF